MDRQAATLGGLHPAEMAAAIRRLPLSRRRVLASALEDERLADLLEELSEDEQVRLVEGLEASAWPACSTKWRPTTPPTCSPSFRTAGARICSARSIPRRRSRSAGCSPMSLTRPVG